VTVLEGIQKSTEFLAGKGVESPRLQSELLLAHILGLPRMNLYLNFARPLSDSETAHLREAVRRRGKREPLQHITGGTSFCGLELKVNRHVLVPRPETEQLAELGWSFLSKRAIGARAVDVGTGSGCLAIALAVKAPQCRVVAMDCSEEALKVARENAVRHGVGDRIEFVQANNLSELASEGGFELIVSNPPYIATGEIPHLDPEVRDFDPRIALDGGADGLDFFRMFASEAAAHLATEGRLMVESGDGQAGAIRTLFESQKWVVEQIVEDYTRRPRIVIAKRS
jgi:release factor glutamine methyltransferase